MFILWKEKVIYMRQFEAICSRNLKIYLRDKGSIFFSFLSMLIVIVLMLIFLGDVTVDGVLSAVEHIPGRNADNDLEAANNIIFIWTCAGILAINGATVSLAFYSNMIKDRNGNRLNSIMVMPISRGIIVAGYIFSAWIISIVMGMIAFVIMEIIGIMKGISPFTFEATIQILLITLLNSLVYSSVMYFFASIIKTESAWSGFGIVVGTLVGFLGGIYFPIGSLSDTVANVVKCFPMIYGTALYRKVMLAPLETSFFEGCPEPVREIFDEQMGINLTIFEKSLSMNKQIVILLGVGILFALLSLVYIRFSKKSDR